MADCAPTPTPTPTHTSAPSPTQRSPASCTTSPPPPAPPPRAACLSAPPPPPCCPSAAACLARGAAAAGEGAVEAAPPRAASRRPRYVYTRIQRRRCSLLLLRTRRVCVRDPPSAAQHTRLHRDARPGSSRFCLWAPCCTCQRHHSDGTGRNVPSQPPVAFSCGVSDLPLAAAIVASVVASAHTRRW